jgi:predicted Fe-Mo cluster-binding NifX family protein
MHKWVIFIISFLLVFTFHPCAYSSQNESPVKIAVAANGNTQGADVAGQGARGDWFLFFNADGEMVDASENPYKNERGGAGVNCADYLARKDTTMFIAGNIGPKMRDALSSHGIDFSSFSGTAEDAVAEALK